MFSSKLDSNSHSTSIPKTNLKPHCNLVPHAHTNPNPDPTSGANLHTDPNANLSSCLNHKLI